MFGLRLASRIARPSTEEPEEPEESEEDDNAQDTSEATTPEEEPNLKITALKTAKTKIKQRVYMKKLIIPKHPASVIFNGSSGSGKTNLLCTLLTKPHFYKGYFDEIHLFSPTGGTDDMFLHLDLQPDNIHMDMDPDDLADILSGRNDLIEKKGIDKVPKILLIFEDVQSSREFMKSRSFLQAFIANRHFGVSTWLCGQSFTKTPRACRLQANNIFYFKGSNSELELISEEFCPPGMRKKEFKEMVSEATREPYAFLHINKHAPFDTRYRKNLGNILDFEKKNNSDDIKNLY
jgi:hypothetical protein